MPYKSMKAVNPAIKGIDPKVTLGQANLIASWADSIKDRRGDVNPWAVAIALFKRKHHIEKDSWVKNKASKASAGLADEVFDLIEGLEALDALPIASRILWVSPIGSFTADEPDFESIRELLKALEEAGFEVTTSEPAPDQALDADTTGVEPYGEAVYVVDLHSDLPQIDGKPDFSQPFRILPVGTIHRYGEREVEVADIAEFEDNWQNRRSRGIRREKVIIDVEHEPGGVGLYADIFSRQKDGLWAKIGLTPRGQELLAEKDFWFFSPTVAWASKDRVTGEVINNQIVGGALTNFPVFGDDTRLPASYSEAALNRMRAEGFDMSAYKRNLRGLYVDTLTQKGDLSMTNQLSTEERGAFQIVVDLLSRFLPKGGDPMPDDKDKDPKDTPSPTQVSAESFAAVQAELATLKGDVEKLSTERDEFAEQLKSSQEQLATETTARQLQEMREHVQEFSHLALPLELSEDAPKGSQTAPQHFAWLRNADKSDGQIHWAFFNAVLGAANAGLEEAQTYTQLGASTGAELSEDDKLHKLIAAYAKAHEVDYYTALKAVTAEGPAAAA